MLPTEVVARFTVDGLVDPQEFIWEGRSYRVDSTGRRWQEADGLHILVMNVFEQVFELLFVPGEVRWYLVKTPPGIRTL